MKRIVLIAAVLCLASVAVACADVEGPETTTETPADAESGVAVYNATTEATGSLVGEVAGTSAEVKAACERYLDASTDCTMGMAGLGAVPGGGGYCAAQPDDEDLIEYYTCMAEAYEASDGCDTVDIAEVEERCAGEDGAGDAAADADDFGVGYGGGFGY